jgi:hypothetical protein
MKQHSDAAWKIASQYSHVLASETRDLAAQIDQVVNGACDPWIKRAAAAEAVLEFIVAGYANQDINHEDFRVHVYKAALETLEALALPQANGQPDSVTAGLPHDAAGVQKPLA